MQWHGVTSVRNNIGQRRLPSAENRPTFEWMNNFSMVIGKVELSQQ